MTAPRVISKFQMAMVVIMVAAAVSCSSLPPSKPVSSVGEIAGKWEGTGAGPGGAVQAVTTISPDGRYTTLLPTGTFTGTVTLVDGKLRAKSDQTGRTGTYTLHEKDGKRTLIYTSDDGRVGGEMTPAK